MGRGPKYHSVYIDDKREAEKTKDLVEAETAKKEHLVHGDLSSCLKGVASSGSRARQTVLLLWMRSGLSSAQQHTLSYCKMQTKYLYRVP